ncbi:MAG: LysR family transcriptional regulator [Solirubrobacterales bacterium]
MDIKQLHFFNAICEEKNITRASERLHVAQPHLSHQLKLMEDELDVKLVERNTRMFHLTEAGERLYYRSKQIIELLDTTVKELKDFNEGIVGTLTIGTIHSSGDILLPIRIRDFNIKYANINFEIRECSSDEILELLKNGLIELGIIRTPLVSKSFDTISLPMEPMVAATGDKSFFEDEKNIGLSKLRESPLLVHRRYEPNIIEACRQAGFDPRILCKIEDTKSILYYAVTGMGIAIIPRDWVDLVPGINLEYRIIDETSLETGTTIVWLKDHYLSSAARHFLETFTNMV